MRDSVSRAFVVPAYGPTTPHQAVIFSQSAQRKRSKPAEIIRQLVIAGLEREGVSL